jgi:hypothetical protein
MKNSLVILIVLVIVILVAIFVTSPTCKNAVSSLFKKPVRELATEALEDQKEVVKRDIEVANQRPAVPTPMPSALPSQSVAAPSEDFLRKRRQAQGQVSQSVHSAQNGSFRVLSGNLEEMFDVKKDVQNEFGISEAELDAMALAYKQTHLDAPKPETIRHRSVRRSDFERSEEVLRSSFANRSLGEKLNSEEMTANALRNHIATSEKSKQVKGKQVVNHTPELY